MKALRWHGKQNMKVDVVPDPVIEDPKDIVLRVTTAAICGSDLHLYDGYIPSMKKGDIMGHEFMGVVVEAGSEVRRFKKGDRVVVPFNIACGNCFFCGEKSFSLCDNSNRNASMAEKVYGQSPSGLFGYSHMFGGYPGGQAEYVRVPYADAIPLKIPDGIPDEKVLFLGDIFSTGYMAAENANIKPGDTVAVWGAGPVGYFTAESALLLGAGKVICIDRYDYRLKYLQGSNVVTINYEETDDLIERIKELTKGRGPDSCIDAVGMEAHGDSFMGFYDSVKQTMRLESDRPTVLRRAIQVCRKGGTISIPGVYGGFIDKVPIGAAFNKSLTFRMGQTHTHRYMEKLFKLIMDGKVDPARIISHRISLDQGPEHYRIFRDKEDDCMKVVIKFPGAVG